MAHLYRQSYTRENPETGEREKRRVRKWYGKYKDANGTIKKVPLCEDKEAAQAMLTDLVRRVEREKAGFVDPADAHLSSSVTSQIQTFHEHMEAKARSDSHVSETIRLINNIVSQCRISVLSELQTADDGIQRYLSARLKEGKSHRTINADLAAIRSFCRWLVQRQRLYRDPTAGLSPLNVEEDRRLTRRALTDQEAEVLIEATRKSERVFRRLCGIDRALLYMVCQRTGLRKNELLSLTPASFDFSTSPATLTVEAGNSKRRRTDTLPLTPELRREVEAYIENKPRHERIWNTSWWRKAAEMLREDLAEAGIEPIDKDGKVLDFHGQRTTFITGLSRAGVSPAVAQKLARHSDINLTMGVYTHLNMEELGEAVEQLPSLTEPRSEEENEAERQLAELSKIWKALSCQVRNQVLNIIRGQDRTSTGNDNVDA